MLSWHYMCEADANNLFHVPSFVIPNGLWGVVHLRVYPRCPLSLRSGTSTCLSSMPTVSEEWYMYLLVLNAHCLRGRVHLCAYPQCSVSEEWWMYLFILHSHVHCYLVVEFCFKKIHRKSMNCYAIILVHAICLTHQHLCNALLFWLE